MSSDLKNVGFFKLVGSYFKTGKRIVNLDKAYLKAELKRLGKIFGPGIALIVVALLLMLVGAIYMLVTLFYAFCLILSPGWAALTLTLIFMGIGMIAAGIGVVMVIKAAKGAETVVEEIGDDIKWIRKK